MSDEIIDDYKLVKHMATGQASQVWEVVEIGSSRHLAMKLLLPERLGDGDNYNFLVHEAEVGLKLAHPNVIRIFKKINGCTPKEFKNKEDLNFAYE